MARSGGSPRLSEVRAPVASLGHWPNLGLPTAVVLHEHVRRVVVEVASTSPSLDRRKQSRSAASGSPHSIQETGCRRRTAGTGVA